MPWGDSLVGVSSLTPLENSEVLNLMGQGAPGEGQRRSGASVKLWANRKGVF